MTNKAENTGRAREATPRCPYGNHAVVRKETRNSGVGLWCPTCRSWLAPVEAHEAITQRPARPARERAAEHVTTGGWPDEKAIEAATRALAWKAACDDDRQTYFHGGVGDGYKAVARPLAKLALKAAAEASPVIPVADVRAWIEDDLRPFATATGVRERLKHLLDEHEREQR